MYAVAASARLRLRRARRIPGAFPGLPNAPGDQALTKTLAKTLRAKEHARDLNGRLKEYVVANLLCQASNLGI